MTLNLPQPPKSTYKAFLWDYDSLLAYSDNECCYCLSEREIQILLAQVDPIAWKTRYKPTETEIDQALLEQWRGNLAAKLMAGNCSTAVLTRQNPEDYCQLQQSLDGGETWETVFDYSLCAGGQSTELYILMQQAINETNIYRTEIYDGSTTSIDPDAPTDTWDYDGATGGEAALCNAVQAYVQNQMLQYYNKLLIGIGAAAVTTGILGWITGGLALVIGGVIVLAAGLAIAAVQAAINNETAMETMICRLRDDLTGVPTTEGDFWSVVTALDCDNLDECTIRDVLIAGAFNEPNYLYFLALIGEAKREVAAGVDNCPCGDDFCYYFSFATAGEEDWSLTYPGKACGGAFTIGAGYSGTDFVDTISSPDIGTRSIGISRTLSPRTLNSVSFNFDLTKGNIDFAGFCVRILVNGTVVASRLFAGQANGTNLHLDWTGSIAGANRIICEIRASRDQTAPYTYGGSCKINSVTVTGIGSNPFGSDNCP